MSILGDGHEAMTAYLTNESGAEAPLMVSPDNCELCPDFS